MLYLIQVYQVFIENCWKRIIAIIIGVSLGISNFGINIPVEVNAANEEYSVSNEFFYTIQDDNTIEINGYYGNKDEIQIPETIDNLKVTSIGESAFEKCDDITKVILPEGLKEIKNRAEINKKNRRISRGKSMKPS